MSMKRSGGRVSRTDVERDFQDALKRLIEGKPRDQKLKRKASEGRLRVNISAVSIEAKRSRTLIGHEKCQFPAIRARVFAAMHKDELVVPRSNGEVIGRLRSEVASLRQKLDAALTAQTAHYLARGRAEREAEKWRTAHQRVERQRDQDRKVTPIRP